MSKKNWRGQVMLVGKVPVRLHLKGRQRDTGFVGNGKHQSILEVRLSTTLTRAGRG